MSAEPILRMANVEAAYGAVKAIRGVSLDVADGSIVTVLGANGAGKTTILKTISGILDPDKGTVHFAGQPIQRQDPAAIVRKGICHVPEGREVFPLLSVRDNLMMGAYTRSDRDEVARDLEAVYRYFPVLRERMSEEAGKLSGGEQQMLAISRALMGRPKLMLLDEPSLGLSPKLTRGIFEIIVRINRERGSAILLVEQNAIPGAADGRLRLRARGRAHRHGRQLRAPARQRRHPRVLPRHERSRRARQPAVEEAEDMAMSAARTRVEQS